MAKIQAYTERANKALYLFVQEESVSSGVAVSTHPVESGVDITDHIQPEAQTLSISGYFVDTAGMSGEQAFQKMNRLCRSGTMVAYTGRANFKNAVIESIRRRYSSTGGAAFDMQLREVRIALSVYKKGKYYGVTRIAMRRENGTMQTVTLSKTRGRYHRVKPGETLASIARLYKAHKVTVAKIKELNKNRKNIFRAGHQGNFNYLLKGASLQVGVW